MESLSFKGTCRERHGGKSLPPELILMSDIYIVNNKTCYNSTINNNTFLITTKYPKIVIYRIPKYLISSTFELQFVYTFN